MCFREIDILCCIYTGHKAGYLAGVYFVGNFAGSLMWGWISDRIGRRPVLLFGVTSTIACELFFGFSQNFTWAIMARLLWGMLNGNIGVVKTYVSEVRTEVYSRTCHTPYTGERESGFKVRSKGREWPTCT